MTDTETAQVQQIRAREQRATNGIWRFMRVSKPRRGESYPDEVLRTTAVAGTYPGHQVRTDHSGGVSPVFDGEFIAHARQDIPFLLDQVARQQAEIDTLKSESVQALARHYGCGEHVSFSDAWRWLAERVEISRLVQDKVETHKSNADTALGAVAERLAALQAEIDSLKAIIDRQNDHCAKMTTQNDLFEAEIDRLRGERDDHRAVASQLRQRGEELQADVDLLRGQRDQELQRRQSAESSLSALREALKPIAAELRHAYSHAVNGRIGNQLAFGRGLLGPQIEKLEGLASPKPEDR